jgi:hypothetical protein
MAAPTTSNAAASWALRPTTPERMSSERPVSSSLRVCRTTNMMLTSATTASVVVAVSLIVIPPRVETAKPGPPRTADAGLEPTVSAYCRRAASVR